MNSVKKHPGMPAIQNSYVSVYPQECERLLWSHDTCSELPGKLPVYAAKLPSFPDRACFLPCAPGCLVMARLHVLVSAGMFGPAVLIGQSVPSLSPEPLWSQQTKPGRGGMYQQPAFTVIAASLDWDCTTASGNTKTVDVSRRFIVTNVRTHILIYIILYYLQENKV